MDKFREMETFISVVECKSFVGASERLRISKSVVSRIIQQLESRLGGRLLQRTTRALSLTDAGQRYYQLCCQIIDDLDIAEKVVGTSIEQVSGHLRVCSSLSFGSLIWTNNIAKFLQRYPDVNFEINWTDRHIDLVGEGYDLAIMLSQIQEDSSFISRKIASSKMIMCAAPDYIEKFGNPQSAEDLNHHSFIRYSNKDMMNAYKSGINTSEMMIHGNTRLTVNTGHNCLIAALAGLGIVSLPAFAIRDYMFSGDLVEILPGTDNTEIGIYVVYPTRKYLSKKVRVLIDFLVEMVNT